MKGLKTVYKRDSRQLYYDHFASRLAERYSLIATDNLYNDILRQIQNNNQATRLESLNRQRSIHCVYIQGRRVFVVYRKHRNALITALPPNKYLNAAYDKLKSRA